MTEYRRQKRSLFRDGGRGKLNPAATKRMDTLDKRLKRIEARKGSTISKKVEQQNNIKTVMKKAKENRAKAKDIEMRSKKEDLVFGAVVFGAVTVGENQGN